MSDINPRKIPLILGGREFELRSNLLVADMLQEEFATTIPNIIEQLGDERTGNKNIATVVTIMVNDYIDEYNDEHDEKQEFVTERWVARNIASNSLEIGSKLLAAFISSFPINDSEDELDTP